jgi:hypothetical protein
LGCAAVRRGLLLLGFLAGITGAMAQGVLTPPSSTYERPAASLSLSTNQSAANPLLATPAGPSPGLFQLGPLDFHPHLLYRFIYGDGIPATPTNRFKTVIQEVSPGVLIDYGEHWSLNYTPTLRFYSDHHFADGTDELVALQGRAGYQDWGFSLSQTYSSTVAPYLETEGLAQQENDTTVLQVTRQLGSHWSAQLGLDEMSRTLSIGTNNQDVEEWSVHPGMNYQFSPRFGVGLTGTAGTDLLTPGSSMKFAQGQGTMNWQLGDKLMLNAGGGVEVRQLLGTNLVNPIFSGTLTYRPWAQTAVSLTGSRVVTPSFFQNDVLVITTIGATLSQRFLQRFNFEVSGGYATTPYVGFATVNDFTGNPANHQILPTPAPAPNRTSRVEQNREDIARFVRVSLGTTFRQRGTLSIFYSHLSYSSDISVFALTSSQFGVELGWRY